MATRAVLNTSLSKQILLNLGYMLTETLEPILSIALPMSTQEIALLRGSYRVTFPAQAPTIAIDPVFHTIPIPFIILFFIDSHPFMEILRLFCDFEWFENVQIDRLRHTLQIQEDASDVTNMAAAPEVLATIL